MLKINRESQSLSTLATPTLADSSITERYDLQAFMMNSPEAFFSEIGQELFLIGEEIKPSTTVADRIDLLTINREGHVVIVELKRGNHKLQMLQAISYAAMMSQWEVEDILALLDDDQQDALTDFLDVDISALNSEQRIVLVAEAYDYALLASAEWLSEHYGMGIQCCRIALATDSDSGAEYLNCSVVYPAPELAEEALERGRRRQVTQQSSWQDWESALKNIENEALVTFFKTSLAANIKNYLPERILYFFHKGRRGWDVAARTKHAYVWQSNRFEGDIEFWEACLGEQSQVDEVKNGKALRFQLYSQTDFEQFQKAITTELAEVEFLSKSKSRDYSDLPVVDECDFEQYRIERLENSTIRAFENGVEADNTKSVLRKVAAQLNVNTQNEHGKELNTRQLGANLIKAVRNR